MDTVVTANSVKSAERAIRILAYFQEVREPRSLKAICESLAYPQSSTTVLLKTLTAMGYLNYDRTRRLYFPTMRVTGLGDWIPNELFGRGEALQVLRDIHHATSETIVLAIRNDIYLQYVVTIHSTYPLRFHVDEGSMRLLTSSCLGWLLLSSLKANEIDTIIRRSNIAAGDPASKNIEEVRDKIESARQMGYSFGENLPFLGGGTLGMLLPTTIQGQPVAIGCGGVLERMRENRDQYLESMRTILDSAGPLLSGG